MTRLPVTYRNEVLCDIHENVKIAEFQDIETNLEGFVDGDFNLLHIQSHEVIVEDADPLTLWFALEL